MLCITAGDPREIFTIEHDGVKLLPLFRSLRSMMQVVIHRRMRGDVIEVRTSGELRAVVAKSGAALVLVDTFDATYAVDLSELS